MYLFILMQIFGKYLENIWKLFRQKYLENIWKTIWKIYGRGPWAPWARALAQNWRQGPGPGLGPPPILGPGPWAHEAHE